MSSGKLYEFRFYQVAATAVGKYRDLASKYVPLRVKQSRMLGLWVSDMGALNRILHIWEYDSLAQRTAVIEGMMVYDEWREFLTQVLPCLDTMDNWICKPLIGELAIDWSDKDLYKVTTVRYMHSESQTSSREKFLAAVRDIQPRGTAKVKAAFETKLGNGREYFLIETASRLDDFVSDKGPFDDETNASVRSDTFNSLPWEQWGRVTPSH